MRVPKRRGEELVKLNKTFDYHLTPDKIEKLKLNLLDLLKHQRPEAIKETQRLAEMGDFSENAGYQIAKGHLRRINRRILSLGERINHAIPIEFGADAEGRVRIGSTVLVIVDGVQREYEIVGPQETNPTKGRISHLSPIGDALIGHVVGEEVVIKRPSGENIYQIIEIK